MTAERLLVPDLAAIESVRPIAPDTLLFRVRPSRPFAYTPGQFAEISVFGVGECPISITSTPTREPLEFAIREVGLVTRALHGLEPGDRIGLRGPLGNGFPVDALRGKHLLFVAGGIGLAPLRGLVNYVLDRRGDYGEVDIVYGARSPELLCFSDEHAVWARAPRTRVHLTVDSAVPAWTGRVGFVPAVVKDIGPRPGGRVAIVCGPPVMIKYVLAGLAEAGFPDDDVITTLELRMSCGVGKCGRCNIGPRHVCLDGPVFRLSELKRLPEEY